MRQVIRAALEAEANAKQLKLRLESESKTADRESQRARELAKKLANTQRDFARAMREKDEHVRREVLATEERMHRELSLRPGTSDNGHSSPTAKALIRTVDELNKKLGAQQIDSTSQLAEQTTKHSWKCWRRKRNFKSKLMRTVVVCKNGRPSARVTISDVLWLKMYLFQKRGRTK